MADNIDTLEELLDKLILKNVKLPIEFAQGDSPLLFKLLNDSFIKRHERKQLLLPNFENTESVLIFSDYGGESKDSKYYTYSFVFVDYSNLSLFIEQMNNIRKQYKMDEPRKEISFKDAHYGQMFRCIDDYLKLANNTINGLVFTLVVNKEIISITGAEDKKALKQITQEAESLSKGKWKPAVLEKSLRVICVLTYFIKLLVPSGKKIFWMTDQDAIVANDNISQDTSGWLGNTINLCKDAPVYDFIGYSPKPYEEDEGYFMTDILSIADLVAGSVEQLLTRRANSEGDLSPLAKKVLQWCSVQGLGLNKLIFQIEKEENVYVGRFLEMECPEYMKAATPIDYVYDVKVDT